MNYLFCCVFLSFAPMWKNLRKSLETTLKIPQDYLESFSIPPKIPLQMPVKSHLDHLQNDSKTTSSSPEDLPK